MLYLVETVVGNGTRCRNWELFREKQKHCSWQEEWRCQKEPREFGLELQTMCYLLNASCERKEFLAKIGPREDFCGVSIVNNSGSL